MPLYNPPTTQTGALLATNNLSDVQDAPTSRTNLGLTAAATTTLPISIANGGTGQTTQQTAINTLAGTQSAGKVLRSDGTNTTLASIQASDVPTLNNLTAPNGTLSLNNQKISNLTAGTATTDAARIDQIPPEWLATDQGFAAWTFDIMLASSTDLLPNAGAIRYASFRLPAAKTITKIYAWITTGGSVLTSGQNFLALYNYNTLALIAQSGDMTSAFAGTGLVTGTISSQALNPGLYIIAAWANGTTAPTFAAATGSSAIPNGNLSGTFRWAGANAGVTTTAPNPLVPAAVTVPFWAAVS